MMGRKKHCAVLLIVVSACVLASHSVHAQGWAQSLTAYPPNWLLPNNFELRLTGFASGAAYAAPASAGPAMSGGTNESGVTGQARVNLRLQRIRDTGLIYGARGEFLIYHDGLSGDAYGNDFVERAYLYMQTGLGNIELGQQIGVGQTIGLTGPKVDEHVSLDNPDTYLFRDPTTGERFDSFFRTHAVAKASAVSPKISYVSPRLFGIQIGASFTPHTVKAPLPFMGNPSDAPNQQGSLWEVAGSYVGYLDDVALGVSGTFTRGTLRNRTAGFDDLYDFALGAQVAAELIDDVRFSFGGAYRMTNAYTLQTHLAYSAEVTRVLQLGAMVEWKSWRFGAEYSSADADGAAGTPDVIATGYQLAAGYRLNFNLELSAGWQWRDYTRSTGTFYNGGNEIDMNGGFLTLAFTL